MTEDQIAEVLAAHAYQPSGLRGVSSCACGEQFRGMPHEHRAHVAAQVAAIAGDGRAGKIAALADEWQEQSLNANRRAAKAIDTEGIAHWQDLAENYAYFEAALRALLSDPASEESS